MLMLALRLILKDKGGKQHSLPFFGSNLGVEIFLKKRSIRKECVEIEDLDNFRQAVESPKSWNSMGHICPKNTFLQLKHIQRIYLTLLSTTYVKIHQIPYICHFWNHESFFTTQLVCIILVQILHSFDKNIPSKFKYSDFLLLDLKYIKFLMSFFKQKVSLSSKFGSRFSVMRDNSSVFF